MHYTMTDLMSKANGLEARRAFENTRLRRIKRRFNPTALSHDNWVALVYPEAKLFLEGLTVERFKEMLNEHRELWHKRQENNLCQSFSEKYFWLGIKRINREKC